jgi:hypothetical protein
VLLRERKGEEEIARESGSQARKIGRNVHGEKNSATGLNVASRGLGRSPAPAEEDVLHGFAKKMLAGGATVSERMRNIRAAEFEIRTSGFEKTTISRC